MPFSPSTLINLAFKEDATATDLLLIVLFFSIFWAIIFKALTLLITPLVANKPWLIAAASREWEHGAKEGLKELGISCTKDEFIQYFMTSWPTTQTIFLQHLAGGALCIPAVLKMGDDPVVYSSLAALGILSEMGWEIYDTIKMMYKRNFTPTGKAEVPDVILFIMVVHHSLTTALGVPTILHYRNLETLHWICFELQFASAVALSIGEYTKLLDVTKPNQLKQFQILTSVAFVIVLITRGFHWIYLIGRFIIIWYQDRAWVFLGVGAPLLLVFSFFNYAFCIAPMWARLKKFMKMSAEYESLPKDVSAAARRKSVRNLQVAAADIACSRVMEEELSSLFVSRKKVVRRQTMPVPTVSGKEEESTTRVAKSLYLRRSVHCGEFYDFLAELDKEGKRD